MRMMTRTRKTAILFAACCTFFLSCADPDGETVETDVRKQLDYCCSQARKTLSGIPSADLIPNSVAPDDPQWQYVRPGAWTSGFWPGQLWYLYEYTHDEFWLDKATEVSRNMIPLGYRDARTHDIGFIMTTSLGNGWRLTHRPEYRDAMLHAADSLARLFNPTVGTILSWPHMVRKMGWPHNTIIDNLMNLELLFWASRNGGGRHLYDIAVKHAETTMENHFREDWSCWHVAVYDSVTGEFIKGCTHQGYSDTSMWARGQAWAIYGYTMIYRETMDKRFLDVAVAAADAYLERLPEDMVPYWDFDAPDDALYKDASAAAVTASALIELSSFLEDGISGKYLGAAIEMIESLSGDKYVSGDANSAFLLHSTGHFPAGSEIDYSISYADYYYLEALIRLRTLLWEKDKEFRHPGILHDNEDFARMRRQIARKSEPEYGSYLVLKGHPCSGYDYMPYGPFDTLSRDGWYRHTRKPQMEKDFSAAYQNSIMWMLTSDSRHAAKALSILLSYAEVLKDIPGTNDAPLLAGLEGLKIIYATEILRHTYAGMEEKDFSDISGMIRNHFIPVMERFMSRPAYTNGNWGPIVVKAYMAAAILWDDVEMYRKAIDFYLHAYDNGTIVHYISGDTGQIQESGRDQGHCMLGIGAMATVCEMAWLQGDDLYSALGNRLLKGFEYVSRYNLGEDVPFEKWEDITGKYSHWETISDRKRGEFIPIFEMAYNHYSYRMGLPMPYTEKVLEEIRPEGYDRDQPSFGSLLFFHNK